VVQVTKGSTTVTTNIATPTQSETASEAVQTQIQNEIKDYENKLINAINNGRMDINSTGILDYSFEPSIKPYNLSSSNSAGKSSSLSSSIGRIIGISIGLLFVFVLVFILFRKWKKKRQMAKIQPARDNVAQNYTINNTCSEVSMISKDEEDNSLAQFHTADKEAGKSSSSPEKTINKVNFK
jgi:predicted PurR-regulated permease PerM